MSLRSRLYSAAEVEFVFENTLPGSKLRSLFHDLIATEGPLSAKRLGHPMINAKEERATWRTLLETGEDVVRECAEVGFSTYCNDVSYKPWGYRNSKTYIRYGHYLEVEEWLDDRYPLFENIRSPSPRPASKSVEQIPPTPVKGRKPTSSTDDEKTESQLEILGS
ncbi:hypothetical protein GLAREA_11858 [Glarea lozoyensis ATCC 20868]|uniref:Uncharacterized protein n=1 Tax=Glarea lozoyensis (strain ATCC 20868 / MF5171) TaxID=1116229 RepID=S3DIF2_GLAL2|nr:uncharacterized protein GLAREA_11858 [Glarea lozoyensis ATCC 20868]EPE31776.1 hypothetical protein GLAREA_11858 [Glarea lozoyensis ATCC 20868]